MRPPWEGRQVSNGPSEPRQGCSAARPRCRSRGAIGAGRRRAGDPASGRLAGGRGDRQDAAHHAGRDVPEPRARRPRHGRPRHDRAPAARVRDRDARAGARARARADAARDARGQASARGARALAPGGEDRRRRSPRRRRPVGRVSDRHVPGRRDPRGDAADGQGDDLLLPEEPAAEQRPGLPLGPADRPGRHPHGAQGPAALAGPQGRHLEGGQHLVRRPDLHRRRRAGGVRRQPRVPGPDGKPADGLQGPEQGLHVRPLQRDLARAAGHGSRPLVSDRHPAAGRPHPDPERLGRVGPRRHERGRRDLQPGRRRSAGPARSA